MTIPCDNFSWKIIQQHSIYAEAEIIRHTVNAIDAHMAIKHDIDIAMDEDWNEFRELLQRIEDRAKAIDEKIAGLT